MAGRHPTDQERADYDAWLDADLEQRLREANDPATKWLPHEQVVAETRAVIDRVAEARARKRRR